MKKTIGIILSLLIIVGVVGCGPKEGKKDSSVDKSTTLQGDVLDFSKKLDINITAWYPKVLSEDDEIIKFIENKFNVNIKYELLPGAEYDKTISMRVAADNLPTYMRLKQAAVYANLRDDGYIVNISEYADKYGFDNIKKYLSNPALETEKEADGFYKMPGKIGPALHGMYIRKDWLDKLGLEIPKTYDDLYTVLKAFADNDLDGQDVAPLTMNGLFYLRRSVPAFTGVNEWGKVDGKWTSEQMVPEYKDFLRTMNKFYEEDLLDKEVFTLNRAQAFEKIALGKAGLIYSNDGFFNTIRKQLLDVNPNAEIVPITPWIKGPKGSLRPTGIGYYGYGVLSNKIPEETKVRMLAILDYLFTEEGSNLIWNGIEGIHYNVVDGKKVFVDETRERDFFGIQYHRFAQFVDYSKAYTLLKDPLLIKNAEDAMKEENGCIDYTSSFTSPVAQPIKQLITDIANKWTVNFITGEADIDDEKQWEQYMKEMKKAGYDTYIDELTKFMAERGK
ncbi:extracellular solute-binding protein [Vallitalea sp.]|uniref:extracellular solute-binding protein n=1 Tax=Vallitalea sp. TaxID=1882829 RepID=UPI0025F771A2|nr:extracellular solute-binding protein [Vallitalea sp.]MCT4688824.1 extracellular solute-binding protein [Vallitalea sp.]